MKKKIKRAIKKKGFNCNVNGTGCSGMGYVLGFLGTLVYNLANATSFGNGVVGILKAIVWPAFLVYRLMGFIGM